MSKTPSLADALKPHDRHHHDDRTVTTILGPTASPRPPSVQPPPSRAGKKAVTGHFDPAVSKQLKQLLLDQDRHSLQELLAEALNDLFQKYHKPPIA
jgi:uncharacterized protein (DUF2236 family)